MSLCGQLMSQPVPERCFAGEHCRTFCLTVVWFFDRGDYSRQPQRPDLKDRA